MKLKIILIISIGLASCIQTPKPNVQNVETAEHSPDTIIVKHENILNKSYEIGFYSKSFSYYWLAGKDTLDFTLKTTEYEKDSTIYISVHHTKPILFTSVLAKINECYPLIKEDFDISKLSSFYFKPPVYYPDLAKELSLEYEQQFGPKNISYDKLNQFLLHSNLNTQLDSFITPLGKKVQYYGIEKFHLLDKKYYNEYLPNTDLTEYPEFTIHGMGMYIQLENK